MHYFAKLVFGQTYAVFGKDFENGLELSVSEDEHAYLATVVENLLVSEGNGYTVKSIPKFEVRTEEFTVAEKVSEEIKDAPDSLKLNKPGRKPAA